MDQIKPINRDEVIKQWDDYDICPDFKPVLEVVLDGVEARDKKLEEVYAKLDEVCLMTSDHVYLVEVIAQAKNLIKPKPLTLTTIEDPGAVPDMQTNTKY